MKLSTPLLALLGVLILMAAANGKPNAVDEDAAEIRNLLLNDEAEPFADDLDDFEERMLAEEADDEDDNDERMMTDEDDGDDEDDEDENDDLTELAKRETDINGVSYDRKCPRKYSKINYAPICASRSTDFIKGGVSKRESRKIVNLHNRLRGLVKPEASDMLKMSWDKDLAKSAQSWAEICRNGVHSRNEGQIIPKRFAFGENLGTSWPTGDWNTVIMDWFNERKYFQYGKGATTPKEDVGHYTAMVWAKSYKIGCGYAQCHSKDRRFATSTHWVCAYGPAGNMEGSENTPYTRSSTGCKGSCRKCKANLCVCGSRKVCKQFGQYLSPKTCRCL